MDDRLTAKTLDDRVVNVAAGQQVPISGVVGSVADRRGQWHLSNRFVDGDVLTSARLAVAKTGVALTGTNALAGVVTGRRRRPADVRVLNNAGPTGRLSLDALAEFAQSADAPHDKRTHRRRR